MKVQRETYKTCTDEKLMQSAASGDRKAFESLYERYFEKLTWFARQYVYDVQAAEDLVQEVFIKIIEQPELFDNNRKFSTWAYTVTANRCKNILRDTQNRKELLGKQPQPIQTSMQHQMDYKQLRQKLRTVVEGLSEKEKALFVLRFEHELPIKEIAEITSSPEGTIKSGIHYLLKKMSSHLKAFTHE